MSPKQIRHWVPRVLAVLFILFISMFALDVFSEYDNILEIAVALFMHLIPSFLLIAATVIAWRWRMAGGVLFVLLGLISILFFRTYRDAMVFLLISMPSLVIGILFMLEASWKPPQMQRDG